MFKAIYWILTTQESRGLFLFHLLLSALLQNIWLDIIFEQRCRCNFVPNQISDSHIAMWINLCVELEIIFGTIDVGREEVEYLNKPFENKLTLANQQSCQNIDCFWSQLKIPNKLGNIRKRKDVINVNILQLIWNKISIPRNIDTILGRRLDCFTCFLWFSWLTVIEDDDDGVV